MKHLSTDEREFIVILDAPSDSSQIVEAVNQYETLHPVNKDFHIRTYTRESSFQNKLIDDIDYLSPQSSAPKMLDHLFKVTRNKLWNGKDTIYYDYIGYY